MQVRWSLLMNGVIEMEVVNPPTPQPGIGAARIAHGNTISVSTSNNIVSASGVSKNTADSTVGVVGKDPQTVSKDTQVVTESQTGTKRVVVTPGGDGPIDGGSDPNHN